MIIEELRAEFNEYFQSTNGALILWLDPPTQWKGIIEHLKKDFRLVEYKGSQLEVKAQVELTWAKGERPKFILYLPGLTRDALTVLKEYEFSGKLFEETVLQSFRRWGIEFDREDEAALMKILPIAARYYAKKHFDFWRENNTPAKLRAKICDDETVRQMLANPENTRTHLKETERYVIFCDYIEDRFGGPNPRESDPSTWVKHFTTYLILTEVRAGASRPSSFPKFGIGWADDKHEDNCLRFVRDWLSNTTYKEDFKRLSSNVEKAYDLSAWAGELAPQPPDCETSLAVERIFENRILSEINNMKTLDALRGLLSTHSEVAKKMAEHFRSREEDIVAWRALQLSNQIIAAADHCVAEAGKIDSVSSLAQKYTKEWWTIDRDYRIYRAKYDGENRLGKLSRQITSIYREFQNQISGKFLSMIETEGCLTIEGIESQSSFWKRSVSPSKRKRAVFLVDALRFELACDLKERLKDGVRDAQVKCVPLVGAIPTLTSIGMATIVSGQGIEVDLTTDGNWNIRGVKKRDSGNLSLREDRRSILKKRHPKAVFYDLEDILKPSELIIGDGNPIVVFTQEMDGRGHESGVLNLSLDYLGRYLDGLVRAIRRLGATGIEEIHIVSDHGFVILDEVTDADKVTMPKETELLYKGHRCIVGKDLPRKPGIVLELANSGGLQFCVPRGTGIFRARGKKQFFHGGLSPQEIIIPYLEVVFAKAEPKYGAKFKAPSVIHNLIFEVELLRAIPSGGVLFGAPRFVEIVGTLVKDNKGIIRQSGPDMVVNQENETLRVRLRIKRGTSFGYGDKLCLELKDADTGELLDSTEISIKVEPNE